MSVLQVAALRIANIVSGAICTIRNSQGERHESLRVSKETHHLFFPIRNSTEQSDGTDAGGEFREAMGLPEPTPKDIERRRAVNSSNAGETCYRCHHAFVEGEPAYRARTYLLGYGFLRHYTVRMLTYCEGCEPRGWYADGRCRTCDREVFLPNALIRRKSIFCSEVCSKAYYSKVQREKRAAQRNKKECAKCGEAFLPPRSDTKFCGVACKQRAYRTRRATA